ncbi:MAG TPA: phosphatidate cytidylyltransferase [Pirellulaceae bacterium]|nr:phosphatidate cytidylyltransferase [Pirellulaceae bacterium]
MLRWRLIFAAIIIAPLVGLVVADFHYNFGAPGILLMPVGLAAGLLAAGEILEMLKGKGHDPVAWPVYLGITLILAAACAPLGWQLAGVEYPADCPLGKLGWPLVAAALAIGLVFVGEMMRYKEPGGVIVNVALGVFTTLYIGLLLTFVAELRFFGSNERGMAALVSLLFVTKLSDTGAYFCGKSFGRHKLAPRLSPGKTIEGAIGGIVTACLASWVFFQFIAPRILGAGAPPSPLWGVLLYGAIIAVAGMLGDLSESLLKRDMQRKDSSSWLPGLGGVLDILDSILAAAPPAFVCWAAGIV